MKLKKMEISDRVVQRLTEYLSILKEVRKYEDGINSIELSKIMDTTSAQVRRLVYIRRIWSQRKRIRY